MSKRSGLAVLIMCVVGMSAEARAQSAALDDWTVTVYPVFAWLPVDIGLNVDVSGGEGGGGVSGEILDSRFDGAYFGGLNASNGRWRMEGYGIWAAFGGNRPDLPFPRRRRRVTDSFAGSTVVVKPTVHGPVAGIGLYF